jgi:dihydroneopterin aldolase
MKNTQTSSEVQGKLIISLLKYSMDMGKILLEGMEFFADHGHYKEEQIIGTKFIVDLEMVFETVHAEYSDHLNDTINYQEVYLVVKREMEIKAHLLESVARRILDAVMGSFPQLKSVQVKISKVNPPLGGKVKQVSCILAH